MSISFNLIPAGTRVPFTFVEFDTTRAQQGTSVQPHKVLAMGQKLSVGSKAELLLDLVTSADQAKKFYGNGSILAKSVEAYFENNKITSLTCIAIDDNAGGTESAGSYKLTGNATASGTLQVYLGGERYSQGVILGDTPTIVIAALVALVTADTDRAVNVAVDGVDDTQMNVTARHKGLLGDDIDIRSNFFVGEELPEGMTETIVAMSGGAGNPDISEIISALDETQYNTIIFPWADAANLTLIEAELTDRFGPIRQNDGVAYSGKRDSFSSLVTLGDSRNSPHVSIMGTNGPDSPWQWVGAIAGQAALSAQIDPARPFQTLGLSGIASVPSIERFSFSEQNLLLQDGISIYNVDDGGLVRIARLITTFQTNSVGAPDTSLLDVNTLYTLSKLRFDFRTRFQLKYPRHKLANDGTRFAPGQKVITPKIAKAETVNLFREWEEDGLVENADQFKNDLLIERNSSDPNRLDFLLSPDLINQLRQIGNQISFLL